MGVPFVCARLTEPGRTADYEYDAINRLIKETIADASGTQVTAWIYDSAGNRVSQNKNGIVTTYVYDANDRLLTETTGAEIVTYSYDAAGNAIAKADSGGAVAYRYDDAGQLKSVTDGANTYEFGYHPNGIRRSKAVNGIDTYFLVDPNDAFEQVLGEYVGQAEQVFYSYGTDLVLQQRSGVSRYYHHDALGSTKALTDEMGAGSDAYWYEAFGGLAAEVGGTQNQYLYAGEQFDPDVGAYYLRARYYSEDTGRFHGMDPADGRMCSPATLNKYTYVENSPLDYVDPSGLMSLGELNTAMNVMGELRGISVRLVLTRKGGKKTTKFIACQVGVAYMEDSIRRDGFEMHHSFNQSFGGAKNQALIALPSNTHHMFHGVLNMFLRADPQFEGLGNWSSKEDWKEWARDNKEARRALYLAVSRAAAMVDRFCELKPPKSLGYFVRRNKRQFLEGE